MRKSIYFRVGAGTVCAVTATASTFLISTFLPSANLVTEDQARVLTYIGFAVIVVGILISVSLWKMGSKYKIIEDKQLVASIPIVLSDMHDKRGQIAESYISSAVTSNGLQPLDDMNRELYQCLGGVQIPNKIESSKDALTLLVNIVDFITKRPKEQLSDYELARLVANSADTHLPIQTLLEKDKTYRKMSKALEGARYKLPKASAEDTTKAIDYYRLYSRAYWAVDTIILYLVEMLKDTDTTIKTAYNIYKDKFQEQMNINMAKVCETIND